MIIRFVLGLSFLAASLGIWADGVYFLSAVFLFFSTVFYTEMFFISLGLTKTEIVQDTNVALAVKILFNVTAVLYFFTGSEDFRWISFYIMPWAFLNLAFFATSVLINQGHVSLETKKKAEDKKDP